MRKGWGFRAAVLAMGAFLGGCTALLGDFTANSAVTEDAGSADGSVAFADGSVAADSNAPVDSTVPVDSNPGNEAGGDAGVDGTAPADTGAEDAPVDAEPAMGPHLSVGSATLDFGTVTVGQTLTPGTISVTNTGNVKTASLTTAITGAAYSISTDGCQGTSLAPSATCQIKIALSDATAGMPVGGVTVTDSAADTVPVSLKANILTPGTLTITPEPFDFKSWVIGTSSPSQTFTVTNTGMGTSGMITMQLTPTNGTAVAELPLTDDCTGKSLAPNGTCTVSVIFSPSTAGPKSGTLEANASPGGPATDSLSGTALAPTTLGIVPGSFAFTTATTGLTTGQKETFVVTNNGGVTSAALTSSFVLGTGSVTTDFPVVTDGCTGVTLAPAASCSYALQFTPTAYGAKSATLSFSSGTDKVSAGVTGTGEDSLSLSVTKSGSATGTVTDTSGAINCGTTCTSGFERTTSDPIVTLTATPGTNAVFGGWSGGGCSGTASTCQTTLSAATTTVNAEFDPLVKTLSFTMSVYGTATGSVASSPTSTIACSGPCVENPTFPVGTPVTLTATIPSGTLFHWTGACSGSSATCAVTMNANETVGLAVTRLNYMFISSTQSNANLGGVTGADATCNSLAKAAGLPGTYQALLATGTYGLTSRLTSSKARGWIRVDGQPFADNPADLLDGAIRTAPNVTELGTIAGDVEAWTGANADGTASGNDCTGFTVSTSLTVFSIIGTDYEGQTGWYDAGGTSCTGPASLYCFGITYYSDLTYTAAAGRIAFLSEASFDTSKGLSGGTAGITTGSADVLCQTEATAAKLPGTYLALMATTSTSAASRFSTTGATWVRPDGVALADTAADFMAGDLQTTLTQHADGTYSNTGYTRTGAFQYPDPTPPGNPLTVPASAFTDTCNDWTTAVTSSTGSIGLQEQDNAGFFGYRGGSIGTTSGYPVACGATVPITCLQQ